MKRLPRVPTHLGLILLAMLVAADALEAQRRSVLRKFCGRENQLACRTTDPPCNSGLVERDNVCVSKLIGQGRTEVLPDPPCGGQGERPCGLDCDEGLTIHQGRCTTCGGEGEPACELGVCDRGYRLALPESADPSADPTAALEELAAGRACTSMGPTEEPDCDCTADIRTTPAGEPLFGFADLHAHPFADLAFGGLVLWGRAFDEEGIHVALPLCDYSGDTPAVTRLEAPTPQRPFLGWRVHGPRGAHDPIGLATGGAHRLAPSSSGPLVGGGRTMAAWPRWDSTTHQKVYYRWLERAYRGGLRLMVSQAVNNEIFCKGSWRVADFGCNDMDAVDRQIDAAFAMERFIDAQYGGRGRGWFRIARSGREARAIIGDGKMAVVLGIEVDTLFDCHEGSCDVDRIARELARYHARGVRHIIPIHVFDNDYGGAASYMAPLTAGSALMGRPMELVDCADESYGKDCNQRGLTRLGRALVEEMFELGVIVDVDHMSRRSRDETLAMATEHGLPVASGHTVLVSSLVEDERAERGLTDAEVLRIVDGGGVVSAMLQPRTQAEIMPFDAIEDDCDLSSSTFAQIYLRFLDLLSSGGRTPALAFGSDFNGMIMHAAPRFGADACGDGEAAGVASPPLAYPFESHRAEGEFARSVTGERSFDYNTDGLAHVGLLPDFIQDLKTLGLSDVQIDPLFRSAEAYVAMWERLDAKAASTP